LLDSDFTDAFPTTGSTEIVVPTIAEPSVVDDKRHVPFKENKPPVVFVGKLFKVSQEVKRKIEKKIVNMNP
jgi:hypothetical protein